MILSPEMLGPPSPPDSRATEVTIQSGHVDDVTEGMGEPLDQYRNHLERRHLAPSTIARYLTDLRALERWLPDPILEATTEQVESFLDTRDHQARSRYRWLSEIHRFYGWAIAHGQTTHDPTLVIERPRLARLLPRPICDDDLARAIQAAGPTMAAWLTLASFAGLRCAEVAHLDRASITPGYLRIVGKGGHERMIPMHPTVDQALARAPLAKSGPVFRNTEGRPYTPKEISRRVAAYLDGLGIEATGHQARHAFGTRAYRASKNLRAVQELMGHADPATTAGYAAVTIDDLSSVVDALPALR